MRLRLVLYSGQRSRKSSPIPAQSLLIFSLRACVASRQDRARFQCLTYCQKTDTLHKGLTRHLCPRFDIAFLPFKGITIKDITIIKLGDLLSSTACFLVPPFQFCRLCLVKAYTSIHTAYKQIQLLTAVEAPACIRCVCQYCQAVVSNQPSTCIAI